MPEATGQTKGLWWLKEWSGVIFLKRPFRSVPMFRWPCVCAARPKASLEGTVRFATALGLADLGHWAGKSWCVC